MQPHPSKATPVVIKANPKQTQAQLNKDFHTAIEKAHPTDIHDNMHVNAHKFMEGYVEAEGGKVTTNKVEEIQYSVGVGTDPALEDQLREEAKHMDRDKIYKRFDYPKPAEGAFGEEKEFSDINMLRDIFGHPLQVTVLGSPVKKHHIKDKSHMKVYKPLFAKNNVGEINFKRATPPRYAKDSVFKEIHKDRLQNFEKFGY